MIIVIMLDIMDPKKQLEGKRNISTYAYLKKYIYKKVGYYNMPAI